MFPKFEISNSNLNRTQHISTELIHYQEHLNNRIKEDSILLRIRIKQAFPINSVEYFVSFVAILKHNFPKTQITEPEQKVIIIKNVIKRLCVTLNESPVKNG